jgi:hypothetical protein
MEENRLWMGRRIYRQTRETESGIKREMKGKYERNEDSLLHSIKIGSGTQPAS